MNPSVRRKRSYDTTRRSEQSRLTRLRILDAARELLLADGYVAMTLPSLARHAGVSPQTVYNLVGGKADVVKAVYDVTLAGDDDPTPLSERPAFRAVIDASDARSYARAYAAWCRGLWERVGPLLGVILANGSGGDPLLAAFVADIDAERRTGNANGLRGLVERGGVAGGRRFETLVDSVWALTAPEVYDRLVRRAGWAPTDYENWLATQLTAALAD